MTSSLDTIEIQARRHLTTRTSKRQALAALIGVVGHALGRTDPEPARRRAEMSHAIFFLLQCLHVTLVTVWGKGTSTHVPQKSLSQRGTLRQQVRECNSLPCRTPGMSRPEYHASRRLGTLDTRTACKWSTIDRHS